MPGTLYVVATPIGNLEDITLRALRILREVDLIAAEDTRRTSKLLAHYQISKPLEPLHEHNEVRAAPRLIQRLTDGASVALVSDAGTPGVSDPGVHLVRLARETGITVVPVPGPSAVAAALSVSGEPADSYLFIGFPPRSGSARAEWMDEVTTSPRTIVAFEAPHRIRQTVRELAGLLAERSISCFREITKLHEELVKQPIDASPERGEYTLVIRRQERSDGRRALVALGSKLIGYMTKYEGVEPLGAAKQVGDALRIPPARLLSAVRRQKYAQLESQTPDPA